MDVISTHRDIIMFLKMKKWKDFQYELFGTTWYVKFIDDYGKDSKGEPNHDFGVCSNMTNTIKVYLKYNHDGDVGYFSDEVIRITLLHEIVHSIFGTGEYINCNDDEPLVEFTARSLISLLKQKIFDYAK